MVGAFSGHRLCKLGCSDTIFTVIESDIRSDSLF